MSVVYAHHTEGARPKGLGRRNVATLQRRWIMRRIETTSRILFPLFLLFLFGCFDYDPMGPDGEDYRRMTLVPQKICLTAGESIRLMALMEDAFGSFFPAPPGGSVSWKSSAPAVVAVEGDGVVLALGKGEATITAGWKEFHASATIRVCEDTCRGGG